MAKIESIDVNQFAIDGLRFPKGDYTVDYHRGSGDLKVVIKNKYTAEPINGSPAADSWRTFTDAANAKFASEAAFTAALGNILAKTGNIDGIASDRVNVTQTTSATTAVTANGLSGIVTTMIQTLAADTQNTFTVNNSKVKATSLVTLNEIYPSGSAGTPIARVGVIADGSFTVVLTNVGTAALNAAVKIGYTVL